MLNLILYYKFLCYYKLVLILAINTRKNLTDFVVLGVCVCICMYVRLSQLTTGYERLSSQPLILQFEKRKKGVVV